MSSTSRDTNKTPVLLKRIDRLEAQMGKFSQYLGRMRLMMQTYRRTAEDLIGANPEKLRQAQRGQLQKQLMSKPDGLAGAISRGEAARVQWVKGGLVIPGQQLAEAWGLTRQALGPAVKRGELFSVKVGNRLYYPSAFLSLERGAVAQICQALGDLSSSEKLVFWTRTHGGLASKTAAESLATGKPPARLERLAQEWARERGVEARSRA